MSCHKLREILKTFKLKKNYGYKRSVARYWFAFKIDKLETVLSNQTWKTMIEYIYNIKQKQILRL